MPRCLPALLLLLALAPWIEGCGSGSGSGQNRPELVGSAPTTGASAESGLSTLRVTFDEPVRVFLPYQVRVERDGILVDVRVFQAPSEPSSVRLTPLFGQVFAPGDYVVRVGEGLVLNLEDHYALEPVTFGFSVAGTPWLHVGSPLSDHVTTLDGTTLAALTSTPTPGGRDPVGLLVQRQGLLPHVFVQLAGGGGSGRALAMFFPGDAAMDEIVLTHGGGDLAAPAPALVLDPEGEVFYAAFVDLALQRVRVARVRAADGVETGSLLLSLPAGPGTFPTGLAIPTDGVTLLVTGQAGGTGLVAYVDLTTFVEVDRDGGTPGTQAAVLGGEAGPTALAGATLLVAPPSAPTADLRSFTLGADTSAAHVSAQTGPPTALLATYDGTLILEGLAPGPVDEPIALRLASDLDATTPVDVVDDVGGLDQGSTRVRALAPVPAQQAFYVLLDADCLARFSWQGTAVTQDDLDAATNGIQVIKLTGTAAGATCIGTVAGSVP